jgi:hypothetical protein
MPSRLSDQHHENSRMQVSAHLAVRLRVARIGSAR